MSWKCTAWLPAPQKRSESASLYMSALKNKINSNLYVLDLCSSPVSPCSAPTCGEQIAFWLVLPALPLPRSSQDHSWMDSCCSHSTWHATSLAGSAEDIPCTPLLAEIREGSQNRTRRSDLADAEDRGGGWAGDADEGLKIGPRKNCSNDPAVGNLGGCGDGREVAGGNATFSLSNLPHFQSKPHTAQHQQQRDRDPARGSAGHIV